MPWGVRLRQEAAGEFIDSHRKRRADIASTDCQVNIFLHSQYIPVAMTGMIFVMFRNFGFKGRDTMLVDGLVRPGHFIY